MRIARKLVLLASMALAAMALTATAAFAENEEIDVFTEAASPVQCSTVTVTGHLVQGGCVAHINGELDLLGYPFGMSFPIEGSSCQAEFLGRIGGDGTGVATSAALTNHAVNPNCQRRPCTEENEGSASSFKPWPVSLHEEAGVEYLQAEFCVWNLDSMTDQRCRVEIPLNKGTGDPGHHMYSASQTNLEGVAHTTNSLPFGCGIRGQATLEGTGLELVH